VALVVRRDWPLVFGGAITVLAYLPYSQIYPIPRLAADSYLYLPSVGAVFVGVVAAVRAEKYLFTRGSVSPEKTAVVVCVVAVGLLGIKTHMQLDRWRNNITLWKPVLAEQPRVWRPYHYAAEAYMDRGKWRRAAATLEAGLSVFRASDVYPAFMPRTFERVGNVERAMNLAIEALLRDRAPNPFHYQVYLGLLARHDLELPDDAEVERVTERAVEFVTGRDELMARRGQRLPLAAYFVRHDRDRWAVPFLRREFSARRPHCLSWVLVERLGVEAARRLDPVPPPPERCRNWNGNGPSGEVPERKDRDRQR
ncbi:MAG: tetratricopeptide repeat protein, partial [Bradymonadaceae bacterium]